MSPNRNPNMPLWSHNLQVFGKGLASSRDPAGPRYTRHRMARILKHRFAKGYHQYSWLPDHIVQLPKNIDDIENIELGIYNQPPTSREDALALSQTSSVWQRLQHPNHSAT